MEWGRERGRRRREGGETSPPRPRRFERLALPLASPSDNPDFAQRPPKLMNKVSREFHSPPRKRRDLQKLDPLQVEKRPQTLEELIERVSLAGWVWRWRYGWRGGRPSRLRRGAGSGLWRASPPPCRPRQPARGGPRPRDEERPSPSPPPPAPPPLPRRSGPKKASGVP